MIEELISKAKMLMTELNKICPHMASARNEFMERFIKTVCAKDLPTGEGKQALMDESMMWGIATQAVANELLTAKEAYQVELLLKMGCEMMTDINAMKCGPG